MIDSYCHPLTCRTPKPEVPGSRWEMWAPVRAGGDRRQRRYSLRIVSAPEPVRVRSRYADLDTFVERFAPNVTRGGIFLASRAPRAVGEVFPFEVQLAGGEVALSGAGKVIWV